jgi:hypothetical protein
MNRVGQVANLSYEFGNRVPSFRNSSFGTHPANRFPNWSLGTS